jgi:hypothetical protein
MNKKIITFIFLLCIFSWSVQAQVAMGKWRTYFAYNSVSQIAQSENKIFAVSEGALFSVDKLDGGIEFYSKISGLNGANISQIEYDPINKQLLIIYENGNIDVLASGGVTNIPDLYDKQMSSSKAVNHIQFYQNKAYLSCDFGVIVLNMQKKEVADTYYIGPNATDVKVLNTTIHNGYIYALSSSTIFKASISEPNLVNYEFWTTMSGLPGSGDFQSIASFSNQLILQRGGKLYRLDGNNIWQTFLPTVDVTNMNVSNGSLNIFSGNSVNLVDTLFNVKIISDLGTITDAEYDVNNKTYWFAANDLGIIPYKETGPETPIKPAGPALNIPFSMTFAGKKLFVVPGGRGATQDNRAGVVMILDENGVWSNIYAKTIQAQTGNDALDFMNVAVDPSDNKHFFVTSYGTGLFEFKNNAFSQWYNNLNSTIETVASDNPLHYMRLDGAIFDKDENLLIVNMTGGKSVGIKILLANGTWTKLLYSFPNVAQLLIPTLGRIMISNQNPNQKWIPSIRYAPGLCVYDDNGTLANQSDDKSIFFSQFTYPETDSNGNTVLNSVAINSVYTTAQDKNGVVWVGTDMGPFLFYNTSNVFNSDYTCSRVKIPRNDGTGLADYLLVNEKIKAIAIDGANRKWIGTESSGVYLMSENGQVTVQHFTTTNSPLLSNNIISLAINPITGEVFFGTDQGIVSYQSDASEADSTFSNVYAYPNPVRENYSGVITITGLVQNTQVKITDLNGNLVCETVSNGSIATWDGKDVHGRKVSTGIYLAICVSEDGTQSTITKILVIN